MSAHTITHTHTHDRNIRTTDYYGPKDDSDRNGQRSGYLYMYYYYYTQPMSTQHICVCVCVHIEHVKYVAIYLLISALCPCIRCLSPRLLPSYYNRYHFFSLMNVVLERYHMHSLNLSIKHTLYQHYIYKSIRNERMQEMARDKKKSFTIIIGNGKEMALTASLMSINKCASIINLDIYGYMHIFEQTSRRWHWRAHGKRTTLCAAAEKPSLNIGQCMCERSALCVDMCAHEFVYMCVRLQWRLELMADSHLNTLFIITVIIIYCVQLLVLFVVGKFILSRENYYCEFHIVVCVCMCVCAIRTTTGSLSLSLILMCVMRVGWPRRRRLFQRSTPTENEKSLPSAFS